MAQKSSSKKNNKSNNSKPQPSHTGTRFTTEKIEEYKEAFDIFDINKHGHVTKDDFGRVMTKLGLEFSEDELDMIISRSIRKDGKLTFYDFLKMIINRASGEEEEEALYFAFNIFDKDRDGFITVKELRNALEKMGEKLTEKEAREMVKVVDFNGDGKIDYGEFVVLMME